MASIVVVGAGMGGLAAAARLAAKQHQVTVLERGDTVGGKVRTWSADGFAFDLGPSLFTLPAVYRHLFRKTGQPLEHEVELIETEPGFRYTFGDHSTLQLPGSSVGRTASAIGEQLGPDAQRSWTGLMAHAADVWRLARDDVLATPLESRWQFARLARNAGAVRTIAPWRSLSGVANRYLPDPRLRDLLQRYATYSGCRPDRAPGALATIPFVEATFGLWHIGGGLGALADAVTARAGKAGARIQTGAEVTRIEHGPEGVTAVVTDDGGRIPADIVVSDIDSRWLPELLGKRAKPRRDASYSGFALMLALDGGAPPELAHHNVWFGQRRPYAAEFTDLRAGRLVADPAIYVCRPDDPAMAPPGCESWFVLVNAPRHGRGPGCVDWRNGTVADDYADHVLALLAERGADMRDRIRWRRIQTPADLADRDGSRDGAIYGNAAHGMWSVHRRAANVSGVPGLYVIGGTAHPGGGLPLVGMGAEAIAERIGRAR